MSKVVPAIVAMSFALAWSPSSGTVAPQRGAVAPVAIPFDLATHHILLKARVNGSRPLSFVLDTGASLAIVRMDVARELGLSLRGNVTGRGTGAGSQNGNRVAGARWSLIGLDGFSQAVTLALPMPVLPSSLGRDVDGIIGGEFVRQFVLELDYQARTIRLHDRSTFEYRGPGETLPIDFNADGNPVVQATVTPLDRPPITRPFLLDTGSGLALALHSPFVAEQRLPGPESKTIRAIGTAGMGGRSVGRLGRVAALQIGSFTIGNPITLFSEDQAGSFANRSLAGNIGGQIASRFRMFFDYSRRRLIVEPSSTLAQPFDRAFSGLALRAEGPDYRIFRVRDVLEDSPATEAGVAEGDIITSVNGRPAESLTLAVINELFEQPGEYELTIRRGDRTTTVTLRPRRLI